MYTYSFEKLEVWKEAKALTTSIYKLTERFPENEKFGLISQLQRASISICPNIAEGSARKTGKNKAHFTTMAFSAAVELLNQLMICSELGHINESEYQSSRLRLESITNKLNALGNHQNNR